MEQPQKLRPDGASEEVIKNEQCSETALDTEKNEEIRAEIVLVENESDVLDNSEKCYVVEDSNVNGTDSKTHTPSIGIQTTIPVSALPVDITTCNNLLFESDQKYFAYGLVWYFVIQQFTFVSDYSYQDLLTMEDSHPGFIYSWLHHAISKIITQRRTIQQLSICPQFVKLITKSCKLVSPILYVDILAHQLLELFIKHVHGERNKSNLDIYTAAGRVMRNYFASNRIVFSPADPEKRLDYGEFLYDGGLLKIVHEIEQQEQKKLQQNIWITDNIPTPMSLEDVCNELVVNGFSHILKPVKVEQRLCTRVAS